MIKNLEEVEGKEIQKRYLFIQRRIQRVKVDLFLLIAECIEFQLIWDGVLKRNRKRGGWWLKEWAPKAKHLLVKRLASLATRTKDPDVVESWQLRLLGIVSSVHHAKKPVVGGRQKRRHKPKSFTFYFNKAQENLAKTIEQMGGIDSLSADDKQRLTDQFGPFADTLRKLGK